MATEAIAFSARIRWLPSGDPTVVGYEVHVRAAGSPYGSPIDAGLPTPDGDGAYGLVVGDLTDGLVYRFTVTAYDGGGERSGCVRELTLGTSDPCAVDECCPASLCSFGTQPDGVPCGDACAICDAGVCSAATEEVVLDTTSFRLSSRLSGNRLRARGSFTPAGPIDPSSSGLTLSVVSDPGILGAIVPPTALHGTLGQSSFRLNRDAQVLSLRSLRITAKGGGPVRVSALLNDSNLGPSTTGWAVRVGDVCARATDLDCTQRPRVLTCR